jgi:hypothetical protein
MADPRIGEMIVYDYIRPALTDGEYRMRLDTEVAIGGTGQPLDGRDFFFDVDGPRFSLSPSEVAGVFPPRNGHGTFDAALPHVALGRRTLPWERPLAGAYTAGPGETPFPFLALVLFDETECEIKRGQALADVVPSAVFDRLGRPPGIRCDAVEADAQLLRDILPMPAELQLLTHVRQVNVDDRELTAGDSDGYFAIVTANRIPAAGRSYVACLVSVEERTDLLPVTDVVETGGSEFYVDPELADIADAQAVSRSVLGTTITPADADRVVRTGQDLFPATSAAVSRIDPGTLSGPLPEGSVAATVAALQDASRQQVVGGGIILHPKAQLVLLHSWTFTSTGDSTFRQLMQALDVGMIGDADPAAKLDVTDTGHIRIDVTDRLGAPEQCWYRGPLVPQPLTRDPLGPYHNADQARRVVADTGAENISYASAFEVGRLLAAADARLAQELMRWRSGAFSASARQSSIDLLQVTMHLTALTDPLDPVALRYSVNVLAKIARGMAPLTDPFHIEAVLSSPLLQPDLVARTFGLASAGDAARLLGADTGLTQAVAAQPAQPPGQLTTVDAVLRDGPGMAALAGLRQRAIDNITAPPAGAAP